MNRYKTNKAKAAYKTKAASLTDQSQANDTDINVIVQRYGVTRTAPGAAHAPMYEDFSELPEDLRAMIEQSRSITRLRRQLPQPLKEIPIEKLLALTTEEIETILQPPKNEGATTEAKP